MQAQFSEIMQPRVSLLSGKVCYLEIVLLASIPLYLANFTTKGGVSPVSRLWLHNEGKFSLTLSEGKTTVDHDNKGRQKED